MVAVTQVALSQNVHLRLLSRILDQAFLSVLELLLLRNLVVEDVSCLLILGLNITKPDGVPGLLHQSFCSDGVDLVNQFLFLVEVLVLTRCFAPILPLGELTGGVLSLLLLASMLKAQENSLFEPCVGDDVRNALVSF